MKTSLQIVGVVIFVAVWLLILRSRWAWFPLGRAVSATAGASAFVALGVIPAHDAFSSVNVETIGLLTGCMLISAHLEKQGGYTMLARALVARGSAFAFLLAVCATAAICAALLTNDTACLTLTPIVLNACKERRLHPAPFLIALATSANIGAACSPVGSPQNMLIAVASGMTFLQFLLYIGLPTLVGVGINFVFVAFIYRAQLRHGATPFDIAPLGSLNTTISVEDAHHEHHEAGTASTDRAVLIPESKREPQHVTAEDHEILSPSALPSADITTLDTRADADIVVGAPVISTSGALTCAMTWRMWTVRGVLLTFPIALAVGSNWIGLGWTALFVASLLCAFDGTDPGPLLARVDGELLLFFSGLFVCVAGLNATELPLQVWQSAKNSASVETALGVTLFSLIVLLGSQVVSNVPLVLLLSPLILEMPTREAALSWALLSWVSTIAGNLTLLGSVANLIVAERAKQSYNLSFLEYGRVGAPSTVALCLIGVPLVCALVGTVNT
jgi:Na+/H+ antiporter NhaD/arsenite permease-like protein